jgi:hypothetical protein
MASEVNNEYTNLLVENASLKAQLEKALFDNVQLRTQVDNLKERMCHLGEAQKRFFISAHAMNDGYKILQQIKPLHAAPINGTSTAIACHHHHSPSSAVMPTNNISLFTNNNTAVPPPQQNQKKRKVDETTIPITDNKAPKKKNLNQEFAKTTTTAGAAVPTDGGKSTGRKATDPRKSVAAPDTGMPGFKLKNFDGGGEEEGEKDGGGSRPGWTQGNVVV